MRTKIYCGTIVCSEFYKKGILAQTNVDPMDRFWDCIPIVLHGKPNRYTQSIVMETRKLSHY
jgi:hypothetical protein